MGGPSGEYYERNTNDGYQTGTRGFSQVAEKMMSQVGIHPSTRPTRRISTSAKDVLVLIYDVTGSPDNLPVIFVDKLPLVAGQIQINQYLNAPEVSLAAVGDIGDQAPLQVCDFAPLRNLDDWIKRLWREQNGRHNHVEAYELAAYYYAYCCDIPKDANAYCVFVADEGMSDQLYATDLKQQLGVKAPVISTDQVFKDLLAKFKGNVFLLHREYGEGDRQALATWERRIGAGRIIEFGYNDKAIADLLLGTLAIANGQRTLADYLNDMVEKRDRRQSEERIAVVRKALDPFWKWVQQRERPLRMKAKLPAFSGSDQVADEASSVPQTFPTPDDLNRMDAMKRAEPIERFLVELRASLQDESRRPLPAGDGWTYCDKVKLPTAAVEGSEELTYIQQVLERANWSAERFKDYLRIRRMS